MGINQKILVSTKGLRMGVASVMCALTAIVALSACGQKGSLYLPNDPEFKQRATLPDIVRRQLPGGEPAPAPAKNAASAPAPAASATSPAGR